MSAVGLALLCCGVAVSRTGWLGRECESCALLCVIVGGVLSAFMVSPLMCFSLD